MISVPHLRQLADWHRHRISLPSLRKFLWHHLAETLAIVSYVAIIVWLFSTTDSNAASNTASQKLIMISGIYLLVGIYWANSLAEGRKKALSWGYVAEQTGLTCTVGRFFSGYNVHVSGTYRGRELRLGTEYYGISQIQSTVISVKVKMPRNASLNIRGPFSAKEIEQDQVTQDLFEAVKARQVGRNGRFYVRGEPYGMVYNLYGQTDAWAALEDMPAPTTIEIENDRLKFQQMIQLRNPDDIMKAFEILSDMADALEK